MYGVLEVMHLILLNDRFWKGDNSVGYFNVFLKYNLSMVWNPIYNYKVDILEHIQKDL